MNRSSLLAAATAAAALAAFPAVASANPTAVVNGTTITVTGDDTAEAITIAESGGNVSLNGSTDLGGNTAAANGTFNLVVNAGGDDDSVAVNTNNLASVTVDGEGGNDLITGSTLADTLRGGAGGDRVVGRPGGDDMDGGDGDDVLVWNNGDGSDDMDGELGVDEIEVNGAAAGDVFTVAPNGQRVRFDRTNLVPFNLDIGTAERLDLNAGGGDDAFTADAGLDALGFALDVNGGDGNDSLDGGDGADLIAGGTGNDRIVPDDNPVNTRDDARGDAGNDTIVWNGGDDDDLNEGGDGSDTIEVNGAAAGEQFTVKPSATAGRVIFDRTGPNPPGPFNIDIGTAERLDLNTNAGDDTVTADPGFANLALDVEGGDGNDSLDGSDAADTLAGGNGDDRIVPDDNPVGTRDDARGDAGNDTIVWNPGDDDDLNEGGDGADTTEINGGDGGERFTVKPSVTPGRVQFDRTGPTPPGPFNVDIGTTEQLLLDAAGGDDRILGAKGLATLIASTFNGDAGNDVIRGTDGEDRLSGGAGRDLINSRDKAEDRVDCGTGLDLARVDRRDFLRGCNIVIGGALRVRLGGKVLDAANGAAALRLKCVGTRRCTGAVRLIRAGKTLGSARFTIKQRSKTVRVKLNRRGRRVLAKAPAKGAKVVARIDARDAAGNGWRTTARRRLTR